jgi:2,5-dihydroxypyridine 5,6-dioxygenase
MSADASLVTLFKAELELCRLGPDETLAVLTQDNERQAYAAAFLMAAQQLGARAFQVNVPSRPKFGGLLQNVGKTPLAGNRPAIEALKNADIVIDLMFLLFSPEQIEITNSGTRMLLVLEPVEVLTRMFPNAGLRGRVEHAEGLLKSAKRMRITSKAGTDVTYELGQYPVITEYGYTDTAGRWDHWPSGFLFTQGKDDGVNGTVVLDRGDIVCAFRKYIEEPVTLRIERGYVKAIDGKGLDAALLRNYMSSFDERAYAISHIGWGLNENAQWHHMAIADSQKEIGMDALSYYGNVLFSTGPNTELGGSNDTPCHLDMPLRNCTLTLDEKLIVDGGKIVPREMQAAP